MSFANGEASKALKVGKDCKDETGTEITFIHQNQFLP